MFSLALKYRESRRTDKFDNWFRYKAAVNPDPQSSESKDGRWMFDVIFMTTGRDDRALPSQVEGLSPSNPPQPPCAQCPTSVTLSSTEPFSLSNNFPQLQSGIGIVSFMQINPGTVDWDGTVITEYVTTNIDTCPSNVPQCNAFAGSLVVGSAGSAFGLQWQAQENIMWDEHVKSSPTSWLNAPGVTKTACTLSCLQTYQCGGNTIGSFTIVYGLSSRGTINGTPVTNVTATKQ